MDFVFGYVAGLLTLINPCVLPVLPIVLASALQGDRRGPLYLCAGMSLSFVAIGVGLAQIGPALGVFPETIERVAAFAMMGFGLVLLLPALNTRFVTATAGLANSADARIDRLDQSSPAGMFGGGALLGAVWSPCIGPTLGGAIALAARGEHLAQATGVMIAFALGVSSVLLALAYGAQSSIAKRRAAMMALAARSKPIMGGAFLLIGVSIWFRWHIALEEWALDHLPHWFSDLSIMF
ncbi:cytochrome c biogenesis CcdA family protein [Roseinatronobacter monicus]|uniref:Cytochrome c biogenesis protein CcdA n=1 Tax=Roseinatronobacter monicus TaxID=393481 RepID=A0A543K3A3_9RHOB|nr:cytochrome c biogenesis CcdA family protein [Roseinatronobacter monicus]TQM89568.1 cytochrome c biogenesis protein CcdA [Roseinatronobacter monicus]